VESIAISLTGNRIHVTPRFVSLYILLWIK